ncbi:FKBP-type peptidyl-prolyl cis-trans isomerase [Parabacteroides chongii]|uniref:FKBP-type peptidyl-prolyl cis-trans isomerase n=1 Tax=Parabacteroides chongii TaxID=2685834 RepID=UPI00240D2A8C|nr:FKBP-type peptidyl-prolyl cis-trans isomerase [Parabacteroides chongii]WFE83246.1 FKBP-type peptidyl-prolyl cis-trans isomerase [Parabacteroides chongii]
MKSIYVALCWVVVMMLGLPACSDDDGKTIPAHTEEEKLWIADNQKYFQERKEYLEDDGQLLYSRLVVEEDTLLYRILETGQVDSFPTLDSKVKVSMLGILPVSKTIIVGTEDGNPIDEELDLDSPNLIKGLSALLLKIRKGERVETIIPYQLGYGEKNYSNPYIPLCSTLQFTFTVKEFK